jgi:hypothetical protein
VWTESGRGALVCIRDGMSGVNKVRRSFIIIVSPAFVDGSLRISTDSAFPRCALGRPFFKNAGFIGVCAIEKLLGFGEFRQRVIEFGRQFLDFDSLFVNSRLN